MTIMTALQNLPKYFIILALLMLAISPTLFGQTSINIEGNYRDSINYACTIHVKITDNKLIASTDCYEFYGQPNSTTCFTYKLKYIAANTISLRMVNSKWSASRRRIRKLRGSKRISNKDRKPYSNGIYKINKMINGSIHLIYTEDARIIVLI